MKNKWMILVLVLLMGPAMRAQPADSTATGKKLQWLAGVDGFSALNVLSVISGVEVNRSRYSISLSHMFGSSRIGVYYDYYLSKKHRVLMGLGFHNSFLFKEFKKSRAEYVDSLERNNTEATLGSGAFLPTSAEVRHQYFFSLSVGKELRLFRGLFANIKLAGLMGINPYYNRVDFSGIYGLQLYYKW